VGGTPIFYNLFCKDNGFMKLPLVVASICLVVLGKSFGALNVIENTPSRLVLQWELDSLTIDSLGHLALQGANNQVLVDGAVVPAVSFTVGLPPQGQIQVGLNPQSVESRHHALLPPSSPLPTLIDAKGFSGRYLWLDEVRTLGRLRTRQILLLPLHYDAVTKKLSLLRSARCVIDFEASASAMRSPPPPASDYYRMVGATVINWSTARSWLIPRPAAALQKRAAVSSSALVRADDRYVRFGVGDGHSGFNEGLTDENGLVRLDGARLRQLLGSSLKSASIALFASGPGELSAEVPTLGAFPAGIQEIPLQSIDRNGNGAVDDDDSFLAFVTGASDWGWDSNLGRYAFRLNTYNEQRHYWVVVKKSGSGLRMQNYVQPDSIGAIRLTHAPHYVYLKKYDGRNSIPQRDGPGGTMYWILGRCAPFSTSLAPLNLDARWFDADSAVQLAMQYKRYNRLGNLKVDFGGTPLSSSEADRYTIEPGRWGSGPLQIAMLPSNDTIEIRTLTLSGVVGLNMANQSSRLFFGMPQAGLFRYTISQLPPGKRLQLLRIGADGADISRMYTITTSPSLATLSFVDSGGSGARYLVVDEEGIESIQAFEPPPTPTLFDGGASEYGIRDVRSTANRADYLIIYPQIFSQQAYALAQHKKKSGLFVNPRMVAIDDIYREFSGGAVDPSAVRNFLWYAKNLWQAPDSLDYVQLFGKGHWDYKNILNLSQPNLIVVAQDTSNFYQLCTEDFFVASDGQLPQLFLGRLPAKTAAEADAIVQKIIEFETVGTADFGAWRNRFLLVADDDRVGDTEDGITNHHESSESVDLNIRQARPVADVRKVYLFEYKANGAYEKPDASQAIINEFNNGVGAVNYFGHGAPNVWSDEHIFTLSDIDKMRNHKRYPLVTSFSCSVGRFDNPMDGYVCLSDRLVATPAAGAIAAVSATRLSYATENTNLARTFFGLLASTAPLRSIGQAFVQSRSTIYNGSALRSYALLGDPSLRICNPTRTVRIKIAAAGDGAARSLDTLSAGQRVVMSGTVENNGALDSRFGTASSPGFVQLGLFNPWYSTSRKDGYSAVVSYELPGTPLFNGRVTVSGGRFSQQVLLPRNVVFNTAGVTLLAYAWQDSVVGLGKVGDLLFDKTAAGQSADSTGPLISLRAEQNSKLLNADVSYSGSFTLRRPKLMGVMDALTLEVRLFDENGIDAVSTGPNQGITAEIPGVMARRTLNHTYSFREGDYQQGSAVLSLDEDAIKEGSYELSVTASDLLGNISRALFKLHVVDEDSFSLEQFFFYPNPVRMDGRVRFYFHSSQRAMLQQEGNAVVPVDKVSVTIKVYTLSGKLVRVFTNAQNGVSWELRDQAGNNLGPNVYLVQATGRFVNSNNVVVESKSPVKKLVIHPPR
jgi:hypothetical protein